MQSNSKSIPTHTDFASLLRNFTTDELAAILHVRPQTLRAALCRKSHYMGMRPKKMPNGRLLWPAADVERVMSGVGM